MYMCTAPRACCCPARTALARRRCCGGSSSGSPTPPWAVFGFEFGFANPAQGGRSVRVRVRQPHRRVPLVRFAVRFVSKRTMGRCFSSCHDVGYVSGYAPSSTNAPPSDHRLRKCVKPLREPSYAASCSRPKAASRYGHFWATCVA